MSTKFSLESTAVSDWKFLAEGGANLVLSYTGSLPHLQGRLLRLRKKKIDASEVHAIPNHVDVRFGTDIITPLMGKDQVVEMVLIDAPRNWLQEMKDHLKLTDARTSARTEVDGIDEAAGVAVLAEDLVHGRGVIAFEIKPKWGFLPSPKYLSQDTKPIKTAYCRFCMHSHYKNTMKAADESSLLALPSYCPLDLYSGDEQRVKQAVARLWRDWQVTDGRSNSFRVFVNGVKVHPADAHTLREHLGCANDSGSVLYMVQDVLMSGLKTSPLLETLSSLQARLDPFDIEGLNSEFALALEYDSADSEETPRHQPTLDEWREWLEDAFHKFMRHGSELDPASVSERESILAYLLSATFKDCSIIARLPLVDETSGAAIRQCVIKAIDLDPKPVDRLRKYYKMDQDIVQTWNKLLLLRGDATYRTCQA